jgi:hypothetical protein
VRLPGPAGGLEPSRCWRCLRLLSSHGTNAILAVVETLADGSYLGQIVAARDHRHGHDPITVGAVDYRLQDPGRLRRQAPHRLVTTILDPDAAPAVELAALYASGGSWRPTSAAPAWCCAPRPPEGVEQEVWGMLLVHYAIRQLMHQAALDREVDPDRVSFVRSLRVVRRQVMRQAGVSPSAAGPGHHGHDR